jgi:hypothetical protein
MDANVTTADARVATSGPSLDAGSFEEASAFLQAAGLVFDQISGSRVTGHLDLGPWHHTPWRIVHGGVYTWPARPRRRQFSRQFSQPAQPGPAG